MRIRIVSATGTGPTPLGAFDAALQNAGVENYNLIQLSSVIPPGGKLERARFCTPPAEYGHRLYVVMAREGATCVGEEAWAGLGWTQESETGRGLFVELHGSSRRAVENAIDTTLESMKESRVYDYGKNEREVTGVTCEGQPVCALAIAIYSSQGWDD